MPTDDYVATTQDSDEEFEILLNEIPENCSIVECAEVDNNLATSEEVDVSKIEWQEKLRNEYIKEVLKVETANSDAENELYVLVMSRTRFRANPHSIIA